jgi:hypothetical protein
MLDFGGNIVRLDEEGIRPVRPALARPGNIDDSVDCEIGCDSAWKKGSPRFLVQVARTQ